MTNEILAEANAIVAQIQNIANYSSTVDSPANTTPKLSLAAIWDMYIGLLDSGDTVTTEAIDAQIEAFKTAIITALETRANELATQFDNLETEQA